MTRSCHLAAVCHTYYYGNWLLFDAFSPVEVIAVVKANAYGHGSVEVARYLNKRGLFHFAVATALEGKELRQNGVAGYIQVLGNYHLCAVCYEFKFVQC